MRHLNTLVNNVSPKEVRHLLSRNVDGPHSVELHKLVAGVSGCIATGTEYEVREQAAELAQRWIAEEGFRVVKQPETVAEPLPHVVKLAKMEGFTCVYDDRYKSLERLDAIGEVPLSEWKGTSAKNGGPCLYSLENGHIVAHPIVPPGTSREYDLGTPEGIAALSNLIDLIGTKQEFRLG